MARAYSAGAKMNDGEQVPVTGVKFDDFWAADERFRRASPENKEAAWLEL
jgi:hypothetical protein